MMQVYLSKADLFKHGGFLTKELERTQTEQAVIQTDPDTRNSECCCRHKLLLKTK